MATNSGCNQGTKIEAIRMGRAIAAVSLLVFGLRSSVFGLQIWDLKFQISCCLLTTDC